MEDADHDKSGSAGGDDWDDDGPEYEVEPPDPDVLAAEQCRLKEIVAASQMAIDVDDIYNEAEGRLDRELVDQLVRNFRFRFQTKHLLLATTVVAVLVALATQRGFGAIFVLAMLGIVGGITFFLSWKEEQRQAELERRRQQTYAERRAHLAAQAAWQAKDLGAGPGDQPAGDELVADRVDVEPAGRKGLRLQFTLAQMMVAIACAAVLLGLVGAWGLAATATLVGFVALGGLVLHAIGFEPPNAVALSWWVLLLVYVVLSIAAAIWSNFQA